MIIPMCWRCNTEISEENAKAWDNSSSPRKYLCYDCLMDRTDELLAETRRLGRLGKNLRALAVRRRGEIEDLEQQIKKIRETVGIKNEGQ